jgi:hypothetical protein
MNPVRRPGRAHCDGEESGKSWRAHREIKGYAGGSKHWTVADERDHATRNGAADEPDRTGAATGYRERYDGSGAAAGSGAEAYRTVVFAGYEHRLHEAEEPLLESDRSLHCDQCSGAPVGESEPVSSFATRWKDLSEPVGCGDTGVDE